MFVFLSPPVPVMTWTRYHRIGDINAWMRRLALDHPDLVQVLELGQTSEGRPILLAKVGANSQGQGQGQDKPGVFVEAGIHAREWISPATATYMIRSLVEDPSNRDLLQYFDFYILPVSNPDG